MVNTIYLLLGTNLGDRAVNLQATCVSIEQEIGSIQKTSAIYETEPWGVTDQPAYWNQVVRVNTFQTPPDVLKSIHLIEKQLGRQRRIRWESRPIDIDILYFGQLHMDSPELTIPHPRLAERRFVLVPLTEIAPDFLHPILQKTNSQLLKECADPLAVEKL